MRPSAPPAPSPPACSAPSTAGQTAVPQGRSLGVNPPFASPHAPCCPPQPRRSVRPRVGSRRSLDAQALREGPHLLCSRAPSHPGTGTPTSSLLQPRCQGVGSGDPAMLLSGPGGCSKNTCFCYPAPNLGFGQGPRCTKTLAFWAGAKPMIYGYIRTSRAAVDGLAGMHPETQVQAGVEPRHSLGRGSLRLRLASSFRNTAQALP